MTSMKNEGKFPKSRNFKKTLQTVAERSLVVFFFSFFPFLGRTLYLPRIIALEPDTIFFTT